MFYIAVIALLFAGIVLTAFLAGGAKERKSALLWSISGAVLTLLAGGLAFFSKNAIRELALKRHQIPAALPLNLNIPTSFMALIGLAAFLSGLILFLWVFNCRKNSSKWYFAALWCES